MNTRKDVGVPFSFYRFFDKLIIKTYCTIVFDMVKYICHTKMNILSRSVYFYLGKNTGSIFAFLLLYFCVATKTSLVFFVRGSFFELRIFIYKNL